MMLVECIGTHVLTESSRSALDGRKIDERDSRLVLRDGIHHADDLGLELPPEEPVDLGLALDVVLDAEGLDQRVDPPPQHQAVHAERVMDVDRVVVERVDKEARLVLDQGLEDRWSGRRPREARGQAEIDRLVD